MDLSTFPLAPGNGWTYAIRDTFHIHQKFYTIKVSALKEILHKIKLNIIGIKLLNHI